MISLERLEELAKGSACENEWCFYKELVSHMTERNVVQARLILEYRYMESWRKGIDIGAKRAEEEFIEKFAIGFAEAYDGNKGESLRYDEIYQRVFGIPKVYKTSPA